ncbi:SEFIR domain-containing protein [Paenibacillus amylolyticus]|uniref:SEFIR domain-containing protein n=1 Tax=Paenibacillus amylolyticus TaxID=1451 RepID=UPI00096D4DB6|nr:SEFIR domain-containing protein [Paenibacillus amylolyticus]OMF45419.1 hypothetical protein BK136_09975 [Paenibacillus amylolyticus]
MDSQTVEDKKVFISYSWTTQAHEEWVLNLATRLVENGVDVVFDKWDLKEGQDTNFFMEGMLKADKVLIICDSGYATKANDRRAGVGIETQIITPNVYGDVDQQKFIPIVAERNDEGKHFIPTYIESRFYIDLSSFDNFEVNYEKLLRNIYQRPMHIKPSRGKAPSYLFEDQVDHHKTSSVIRQMKSVADKNPSRLLYQWNQFVEQFFATLSGYKFDGVENTHEIDEIVVEKIDKLLPIRDDFISALEMLIMTDKFEADRIVEFFEEMYGLTNAKGNGSFHDMQFDHFKFLTKELFLYTSTILLKERKYVQLSHILNADYFVNRENSSKNFTDLNFQVAALEHRNQRLNLNKVSLLADKLIERSSERYKRDIISTDIMLYIISKITIENEAEWKWAWFPNTYIYLREINFVVKLLAKLKSRNHFENIKILFNVDDIVDFKNKVENIKIDKGYSNSWGSIVPSMKTFLDIEAIGSKP